MKKNTEWKVPIIILVGIVAVFLLGIFGVQSYQNKAISLGEQVKAAKSDIKVKEKGRYDSVTNLADCVKQYDKHEAEVIKSVAESRNKTISDNDMENVQNIITAVAEAYPDLESSANYKTLMNDLAIRENQIAEYRENYNKEVKSYRKYVKSFPARVFLNMLGYESENFELLDFDVSESAPTNLFSED